MPFFIRNKPGNATFAKKKRTAPTQSKTKDTSKKIKRSEKNNEIISSEDELSGQEDYTNDFSSEEETEQEKKLRLTKKYLEQIENEEKEKTLPDLAKDAVALRLKEEALDEAGKLQKKKAHEYENVSPEILCIFKGHKLSVTCVAVSSCEKYVYSASKDCAIIKWSIETQKRLKTIPGGRKGTEATHCGHTDHILAMALSSDNKFLATGCKKKLINIWNADTMEHLKKFKGHKDSVTGLTFQKGSHQLISASNDRSLKLWNLDEMGYVETLFGHQDNVTGIDCFIGENALTSGGRDNTLRIWKIVEESQLVFQAHGASMDCVCASSHNRFLSGADDGSILLWGNHKKKPLFKLNEAHGSDLETGESNWIVTLCALPNTDLVASGSNDGCIRLWRRDDDKNVLSTVNAITTKGFVNCLQFSPTGKYLIAGIGQEHRLGRWWKLKESKNSVVIYSWSNKS